MISYIYTKFFSPGDQIKSSNDLVKYYNNLMLNSSIFSRVFKYSMASMLLLSPFIFKKNKFVVLLIPLMLSSSTSISLLEYNTKILSVMHLNIRNAESLTTEELEELRNKLSEIDKIWEN